MINYRRILALLFLLLQTPTLRAQLRFLGRDSSLLVKSSNSLVRIGKSSKVRGFYQDSIVSDHGYDLAHTWTGFHTAGTTNVGTTGDTPHTHLIKNNSNAIASFGDQLNTIDTGPGDVTFDQSSHTLTYDYFISPDHKINITTSTEIDGAGHAIKFARDKANTLVLSSGVAAILKNMVLKDFSTNVLSLASGASVKFGDGCVVQLAADENLQTNLSFEGTSTLDGYGNRLHLQGYTIETTQPSKLTLQNINLESVRGNNIRCVGDHASLVLKDCSLFLDRQYSFTAGTIRFESDVVIGGTNTFIYHSNYGSTIAPHATLALDVSTTFSYAPSRSSRPDNRDLILMSDVTSKFHLNGCTLVTTPTGMRLTKGTLIVDHKVTLQNIGSASLSQAISFGNGTAADDLSVHIRPAATLELGTGVLHYQNSA